MKTSILTLIFTVALVTSSIAQPVTGNPKNGKITNPDRPRFEQRQYPGDRFDRMAAQLELTDDQKTKIDALQTPHLKKMTTYRNQLDEKQAQLKTLTMADKPDSKKINTLVDEIGGIKASQQKDQIAHRLSIRELLNEDQRVKFDAFQQKAGKRDKKRQPKRDR